MQPSGQNQQSFLAKALLKKRLVSSPEQAHAVSLAIMIGFCIICALILFSNLSGGEADIPPEYYYDPTRTDATS